MSDKLTAIEEALAVFGSVPTFEEMPHRTLGDKGIAGPTAAHVIEEVHSPFNLAYLTFTTGSSAFQTIVGVTYAELPDRSAVARAIFGRLNLEGGARMLVTYPPLVNVFSKPALDDCAVTWSHLQRSSRDALLLAACREAPQVILGESSFLRAGLEQAEALDLKDEMPKNCVLLCAGTPLDQELIPVAARFGYEVHDLYGCQEFGWLVLDGVPLRDDISLVPSPRGPAWRELVVGGLPMGDSFLVSAAGHVCDREGQIITYRRERTYPEYEVIVRATPASANDVIEKTARTVLRIKSRVVKVPHDVELNAAVTRLELVPGLVDPAAEPAAPIVIEGPDKTRLFEAMVTAQRDLSQHAKTDPAWVKRR
ncbi:acyl carrier protein [Rhodobacter lacus]|uniref:Acyl carrier protein n=1 Tax=Rhodobacter lacus TaxID=1641972 RepID=A0ABW5A770_9RHOB